MLGTKQLEIHGKWWFHFCACFWVYFGARTCDVFSLVCYLTLCFDFCLPLGSLFSLMSQFIYLKFGSKFLRGCFVFSCLLTYITATFVETLKAFPFFTPSRLVSVGLVRLYECNGAFGCGHLKC